jgi:FtsH-binding integral membrane protein
MAYSPDFRSTPASGYGVAGTAAIDQGLRAYMLRVYNWMASGLLLTGVVAYGVANTSLINLFYHRVATEYGTRIMPTGLGTLSMFAPLAFVLVLSFGVNRMSRSTVQALYCSFLIMGLWGIVLASVLNMFLHSSGIQFAVSIIGVVVFTGLTAYDTQRIKVSYTQFAYAEGTEGAAKRSVYDALSLYLNFINLFMMLLQLTGNRNNNN